MCLFLAGRHGLVQFGGDFPQCADKASSSICVAILPMHPWIFAAIDDRHAECKQRWKALSVHYPATVAHDRQILPAFVGAENLKSGRKTNVKHAVINSAQSVAVPSHAAANLSAEGNRL